MPVVLSLALGVLLGLASGGSFRHLEAVRLKYPYLLLAGFVLQGAARGRLGIAGTGQWSVLAWGMVSILLVGLLLLQPESPALVLVAVGISLNLSVVLLNGFMPIVAGIGANPADVTKGLAALRDFYSVGTPTTIALVLADVLPLPFAGSLYLLSVGDVLLICGTCGFLVRGMVLPPAPAK